MACAFPDMAKRGKGAIINILLVAGLVPVALSRRILRHPALHLRLTQAIAQEYSGHGVVIQEVDPGQVDSVSSKCMMSGSSLLAPFARRFVNSAIRTGDTTTGRAVTGATAS